jgi:hypothetical protein
MITVEAFNYWNNTERNFMHTVLKNHLAYSIKLFPSKDRDDSALWISIEYDDSKLPEHKGQRRIHISSVEASMRDVQNTILSRCFVISKQMIADKLTGEPLLYIDYIQPDHDIELEEEIMRLENREIPEED